MSKFRENIEYFAEELGMDMPGLIIDLARVNWETPAQRDQFVADVKGAV